MKKGLILGLLLGMGLPGVMAVDLTETPEQEIGYFKDLVTKGTPVYDSRAYASINAAVTAIGATEAVLAVYESETLTASLTIPATCSLYIAQGGMIVQASTYTLTINGSFEAGLYQVFSGFTTVALAKVERILPQWFGATGDGVTDDTEAVQAAVDACTTAGGGTVYFLPGTYLADIVVDSTDGYVRFMGAGARGPTILKAATASGFAITLDNSNSAPFIVENIYFLGSGNTTSGIQCGDTEDGIANLFVRNCRFSKLDTAIYIYGRFYWRVSDSYFSANNYDIHAEGTVTMQASSALIDHCYMNGAKKAAIRLEGVLYGVHVLGGIIEATKGFAAYITGQASAGYGVVFDQVHFEGNAAAVTVNIDGTDLTPYAFYLNGARHVEIRQSLVESLAIHGASCLILDRCPIDVDAWSMDSSGDYTVVARNGTPHSVSTTGAVLNDIYHESRSITSALGWVQVAPGPLTDHINWTRTNKFAYGSMASAFTPTNANGNTIAFSGAYDAPIHGRCMTIDFAGANQAYTDGAQLFPNTLFTQNKWYVWSLDVRSVTDEGQLSSVWRATANLKSAGMTAYPDRWTRYWGVARYIEATNTVANWVWNSHATANPTYLLANVQLVEFDTADEAEKFINEAAYCPDAYMPLVAQQGLRVTGDIVNGDDTMIATKTVYKTIDVDDDASTDDYQFDDDAENTTEQVITLTNILPAYAELVGWQIRCFETVTGSASMQIDFGTTSSGTELGTGSPDTANDILGTEAAASPVLAATNAARSLYISATPGANWNTLDAGRWSLMITYVDYSAVHTQKNP